MSTTTKKNLTPAEKARITIERKAARVLDLLTRPITTAARIELVSILSSMISFHRSGKIEGIFSLDTSADTCQYCQAARKQAENNPAHICRYCYIQNEYKLPRQAHAITSEILSRFQLTPEEAAAVAFAPGLVRFNSDGELINDTHARNLVRIAKAHPFNTFAIWTKRPHILQAAIESEGKPANLIIGLSSPIINSPLNPRHAEWIDFIFTVYTPEGMKAALESGARECNGRKCKDCGFKCYQRTENQPSPVNVAEALRKPQNVSKKQFETICATIDAKTVERN